MNCQSVGVFLIAVLLVSSAPALATDNYGKTFHIQTPSNLFNHQFALSIPKIGSSIRMNSQKLEISITPTLLHYYENLPHVINDDCDYAQLLTPQAVAPIAQEIEKCTDKLPHSNEQFANAVLALVHQIPYNTTGVTYPIETLVNNEGNCVSLSLLAASIMEAGGLNVVLIHYTGINPAHMNVGLYLPYTPIYHSPLKAPSSFTYNNKTFWTAEATPAGAWKVGDQSWELNDATVNIIPINNTNQSPSQISASLNTDLVSSNITVNASQYTTGNQSNNLHTLIILGAINPAIQNQKVVIYNAFENQTPQFFVVSTDKNGDFSLNWNFTKSGTYHIMSSWSGVSSYAGADSQLLTVLAGPQSVVQFDNIGANYIFGPRGFLQTNEVRSLQGVSNFLNIPLGTNISLTYNFEVIKVGHPISNVQARTITIPQNPRVVNVGVGRNAKVAEIPMPDKTVTEPINVPSDLRPIMLPVDFNQTIHNQLCVILQSSGGNYSFSVKALNGFDISNLIQSGKTFFMNDTENIQENNLYRVTESISCYGIVGSIYNADGVMLGNVTTPYEKNIELVTLLTNNVDCAVVLKDISIQTLKSLK